MRGPESPADEPPYLSIVLTGRNDSYGHDFNERLFRTIQFNHRELVARGIPHEFVFVEWAPPADAPRLLELIAEAAPDLDRRATRWFVVDPAYQEALSLSPRLRYLEYVAKNVGIRRARGRFVLATNCDIYLGRRVLERLEARTLVPRVVYRAARHDLKLAIDQANLGWDLLEDPRNLDGPARQLKPPHLAGGTGDFLLLDRDTFVALQGFNEVYRLVRVGIDRNFVVKAVSGGLPLEDIGGAVYHVNHVGTFRKVKKQSAHANATATSAGERWHANQVIYRNPDAWGLATAPFAPCGEQAWYLAFSWDAVPPLANIRGVMLPAARGGQPRPSDVPASEA